MRLHICFQHSLYFHSRFFTRFTHFYAEWVFTSIFTLLVFLFLSTNIAINEINYRAIGHGRQNWQNDVIRAIFEPRLRGNCSTTIPNSFDTILKCISCNFLVDTITNHVNLNHCVCLHQYFLFRIHCFFLILSEHALAGRQPIHDTMIHFHMRRTLQKLEEFILLKFRRF